MGKPRDREFKDYVCRLIVEDGRQAKQVSYELKVPYGTVIAWVADYKKRLKKDRNSELVTPAEVEKLKKQHEKEMQKLKEENEILKKAMHIFTKNQE